MPVRISTFNHWYRLEGQHLEELQEAMASCCSSLRLASAHQCFPASLCSRAFHNFLPRLPGKQGPTNTLSVLSNSTWCCTCLQVHMTRLPERRVGWKPSCNLRLTSWLGFSRQPQHTPSTPGSHSIPVEVPSWYCPFKRGLKHAQNLPSSPSL